MAATIAWITSVKLYIVTLVFLTATIAQQQQAKLSSKKIREQRQLQPYRGQQQHHQRLAIWIDKKEIEHFAGNKYHNEINIMPFWVEHSEH